MFLFNARCTWVLKRHLLSQYSTIQRSLRLMKKRKTNIVSIMEINRAILMCEWTIPLLVSLDIGTRVTSKLTPGFTVHVADNGSVLWIICKFESWSNKVINLCVIYPAQPMMYRYITDLNKGCMQNKNVLKVRTIIMARCS